MHAREAGLYVSGLCRHGHRRELCAERPCTNHRYTGVWCYKHAPQRRWRQACRQCFLVSGVSSSHSQTSVKASNVFNVGKAPEATPQQKAAMEATVVVVVRQAKARAAVVKNSAPSTAFKDKIAAARAKALAIPASQRLNAKTLERDLKLIAAIEEKGRDPFAPGQIFTWPQVEGFTNSFAARNRLSCLDWFLQ